LIDVVLGKGRARDFGHGLCDQCFELSILNAPRCLLSNGGIPITEGLIRPTINSVAGGTDFSDLENAVTVG
jgi:hypothetical protein